MKATGIVVLVGIFAVAGLAIGLAFECQACQKLDAENAALRRQLGKIGELTAENQRLSNLLAQANAPRGTANGATRTNGAPDGRLAELARLRSQMEARRQQSNEVTSLRGDTRATRDALEDARQALHASRVASRRNHPGAADGGPLAILEADYGTERTNREISAELNDRIRGGSLKTIADNGLAGDPDFGHVKNLTVVYRFGGTLMTNQFQEGDMIILPPDAP
jgi:hypothetical protein